MAPGSSCSLHVPRIAGLSFQMKETETECALHEIKQTREPLSYCAAWFLIFSGLAWSVLTRSAE